MKASYQQKRGIGLLGWLLIVNVAVFALQNLLIVFLGEDLYRVAFLNNFALSGAAVSSAKVWTLFTYGFLHDTNNFFHLLFNGLGLFFIGRMVIRIFGEKAFLEVFLLSTLTGGLLYLCFHFTGLGFVLGASGALMGVLALFCMARPEEKVTLLVYFVLPVTLKPKWILWGTSAISVLGILFQELPGTSYTAHSAHLGGILGGVLYYQFLIRGKSFSDLSSKFKFGKTSTTPPPKPKVKSMGYSVNFGSKDKLKKEVDRILDKINEQGFGSLTDEERRTLDRARDTL